FGDVPFLHQAAAQRGVEGLLGPCDDAGGDPPLIGGQRHAGGAAESVRHAVQESLRPKDDTYGGRTVKAAADGRVVDGAGLLAGNVIPLQMAAVEPGQVEPPQPGGQLRIPDGAEDGPLAAPCVGGVQPRRKDGFQILPGHLPGLVFANGTSADDRFLYRHGTSTSFQHSGSGAYILPW